jgi:prepilin-type N-terminal cleavage/methylation domain-containing protein
MNKKQDKGFTLVELLIVIVILGILASVTVFAVRNITDKGQENSCKVEKRAIETAIEAYYVANSSNPTGLADLVPNYLKDNPNLKDPNPTVTSDDRWTFSGSTSNSTSPTIAGVNDCAGA